MPGGTERSGVPSNSAAPLVGWASPARGRSSVVFPAPLGPTTQANSPRATSNVMSCSATFGPAALAYTLRTCRSDTTGVASWPDSAPGFRSLPFIGCPPGGITLTETSFRVTRSTGSLHGASAVVPVQDAVLRDHEQQVRDRADDREDDDPRPHAHVVEGLLRVDDVVADAVGGRLPLGHHHEDDGDLEGVAQPGDDLRGRGGQHDAEHAPERRHPKYPGRVELDLVDAAHAVQGVEQC